MLRCLRPILWTWRRPRIRRMEVVVVVGEEAGGWEAIFSSERDARRVVNIMHKRDMGPRYIECFYEEDQ